MRGKLSLERESKKVGIRNYGFVVGNVKDALIISCYIPYNLYDFIHHGYCKHVN